VTFVAGVLAGIVACGGDDGGGSERGSPTPAAKERVAQELPAAAPGETDVREAGATAVSVDGDWLAAGAGGVWLTAKNSVLRLDPSTGRVVATVAVPQAPCMASVTGFGALWTATCSPAGLARIDPGTNQVTDHVRLRVASALGGEGSIGVGTDGIWLVVDGPGCSGCRLIRVDPETMHMNARVRVSEGSAAVRGGLAPFGSRIPTQAPSSRWTPGASRSYEPSRLAAYGAAWTLNQVDGTVTRVDARTGRTTTIEADLAGSGGDMAAGGQWVWARASAVLLSRIDPRTSKVVERYGPAVGSGGVAVGYGAVWIAAHDVDTVWRLPIPSR
jgi:virginiamycin B lyase